MGRRSTVSPVGWGTEICVERDTRRKRANNEPVADVRKRTQCFAFCSPTASWPRCRAWKHRWSGRRFRPAWAREWTHPHRYGAGDDEHGSQSSCGLAESPRCRVSSRSMPRRFYDPGRCDGSDSDIKFFLFQLSLLVREPKPCISRAAPLNRGAQKSRARARRGFDDRERAANAAGQHEVQPSECAVVADALLGGRALEIVWTSGSRRGEQTLRGHARMRSRDGLHRRSCAKTRTARGQISSTVGFDVEVVELRGRPGAIAFDSATGEYRPAFCQAGADGGCSASGRSDRRSRSSAHALRHTFDLSRCGASSPRTLPATDCADERRSAGMTLSGVPASGRDGNHASAGCGRSAHAGHPALMHERGQACVAGSKSWRYFGRNGRKRRR